ncbi:serine/threonine-protein kinase [Yinghuangia aomiensis]
MPHPVPAQHARSPRCPTSVATLYDVGEDVGGGEAGDTTPFLVMEFVDGRALADALRDGPVPTERALAIARDVADALVHSHGHGLVHRDIKPSNVMLTATGSIKVLDFSIAKALAETTTRLTATGMTVGTPPTCHPSRSTGRCGRPLRPVLARLPAVRTPRRETAVLRRLAIRGDEPAPDEEPVAAIRAAPADPGRGRRPGAAPAGQVARTAARERRRTPRRPGRLAGQAPGRVGAGRHAPGLAAAPTGPPRPAAARRLGLVRPRHPSPTWPPSRPPSGTAAGRRRRRPRLRPPYPASRPRPRRTPPRRTPQPASYHRACKSGPGPGDHGR